MGSNYEGAQLLNDELLAARLRRRIIQNNSKKVLIANLRGSGESQDNYTLVNCNGFGRTRIFQLYKVYLETSVFPERPIRPNFRGHPANKTVKSQVFQLAACNLRCWYCFVDDDRSSANRKVAAFLSADELSQLYIDETDRVGIIDLSGGQPDLVPEWTLWMIDAAERRGLLGDVYFWIDDNLSNNYLFRYLQPADIARMASTPRLTRMGCFKGFDPTRPGSSAAEWRTANEMSSFFENSSHSRLVSPKSR